MDELIKRMDALEAIAQLALPYHIQRERILDALQKVPAADAVQVIGCHQKNPKDLEAAIKQLHKEYERANKLEFVHNPLAYALHKVWRTVDGKRRTHETD